MLLTLQGDICVQDRALALTHSCPLGRFRRTVPGADFLVLCPRRRPITGSRSPSAREACSELCLVPDGDGLRMSFIGRGSKKAFSICALPSQSL